MVASTSGQSLPPCTAERNSGAAAAAFAGVPPTRRRLHTSSLAGAAAAAAAPQPAAAAPQAPGRQRISPNARAFQQKFFQMVNTAPEPAATAGSSHGGLQRDDASSPAVVSSQAVRLLLDWVSEGRMAAEKQQQQGGEGGGDSSGSSGGVGVAAPYCLEQGALDRAFDVILRLLQDDEALRRGPRSAGAARAALRGGSGGDGGGGGSSGGRMGLAEMAGSAEELVAAAEDMGLVVRQRQYELLLQLHWLRSQRDEGFRRQAAERVLGVRGKMVKQMLQLSPMALVSVLEVLLRQPRVGGRAKQEERLAAVLAVIDRDLPPLRPAGGAAAAAAAAASYMGPRLQWCLETAVMEAVELDDWAAYRRLDAVFKSRTRRQLPYGVLLKALKAAAGGRQKELALEILAELEVTDAEQPQPQPQQQPRHGDGGGAAAAGGPEEEARALGELVRLLAAEGDEAAADRVYERLRRVAWRAMPTAATSGAVAEGAADEADEADGGHSDGGGGGGEGGSGAALQPKEAAALAAAAAAMPAPAAATLALLPLPLGRRDWRRVLELVGSLAVLHSLGKELSPGNGHFKPALGAALASRLAQLGAEPAELEPLLSAYGGLGPLSEALMASEEDTVAYYSELLRRVAETAAAAASSSTTPSTSSAPASPTTSPPPSPDTAAVPFGGSPAPFGPPLRAAASRHDLASVSEIVKQMRALGCAPGADAYAAVVDASLCGGKPERVAGLLALMEEQSVAPSSALWEVRMSAAAAAGDIDGLSAVIDECHAACARGDVHKRGVAGIRERVLKEALAAADAAEADKDPGRARTASFAKEELARLRMRQATLREEMGAAQERLRDQRLRALREAGAASREWPRRQGQGRAQGQGQGQRQGWARQ